MHDDSSDDSSDLVDEGWHGMVVHSRDNGNQSPHQDEMRALNLALHLALHLALRYGSALALALWLYGSAAGIIDLRRR